MPKRKRFAAQTSVFDEIIVDSFAGGGGASTGIELASGRVVDIAINHDPDAILMHRTNHPYTAHYQESVWDVDPVKVCAGRPVGLLWASPDCKHFSKASGKALKSKRVRGLAWVVLRWAATVRPRVIMLENVEEFQTWGPVRKGKPVKSKSGETFLRWKQQLLNLGYRVEHRELIAADYGAPTTRKRFFLIARCDGQPIRWPESTHAPRNSPDVQEGRKLPWKSAAEIIDWSLPCPSIFDTREQVMEKHGLSAQRPLKSNTLRRIARGVDKFVIKNAEPFIVGVGGRCGDCPPRAVTEPHRTVTAKADAAVCSPCLIQYHSEKSERVRGQPVTEPVMTVDSSNRYGLTAAALCKYYMGCDGQKVTDPLHTVTVKPREGLIAVHMEEMYGTGNGRAADMPLATVTAIQHHGLVVTHIQKATDTVDLHHWPEIRALLNQYCGYTLADDEILLFRIDDADYFMNDIGLRMLTPRELYQAQGFPDDYIIDHDYTGRHYGKAKQVARCGNAVPPPFATALVQANFPEWCGGKPFVMMENLISAVSV